MEKHLRLSLRGWQAYACDRALEHDASGALIWSQVLLTVARQSGKSTLARGISLWRMCEGADLFGEPQLVLSAANKLPTAWEVMEKGLAWVEETYPGSVRRGNNRPGITLPGGRGRWVPLAANRGAGTGYSSTMLFVDEVWDIDDRVVDDDLEPTLAEANSGQVWLTSTAGDSGSTLFSSRRARAIAQADGTDDDDTARMLILEWSAPPEADIEDEDTWKWASPEWSDKRVKFLRDKWAATTNVDSFRVQFGNQWVRRLDGWLNSRTWERTIDARDLPADAVWAVVAEVSKDESEHAVAVAATDDDGRIVIRLHAARTYRDVDDLVAGLREAHRALTFHVTPSYHERIRGHTDGVVGGRDVGAATAALLDAFGTGLIAHDGSAHLEEHLFRADLIKHDAAYKLVGRGDTHAHGARAIMFAVWQASKVQKPAPIVHVRRSG